MYTVNPEFDSAEPSVGSGWVGPQCLNQPPTQSKLESELRSATKNKAPGQDGLRVEELACLLDTDAMPVLAKLLELFWFLEKVPPELKNTISFFEKPR